jgi:hypothetical protein
MHVLSQLEICVSDEVPITGCDCEIFDVNLFMEVRTDLWIELLKIRTSFVVGTSKAST